MSFSHIGHANPSNNLFGSHCPQNLLEDIISVPNLDENTFKSKIGKMVILFVECSVIRMIVRKQLSVDDHSTTLANVLWFGIASIQHNNLNLIHPNTI